MLTVLKYALRGLYMRALGLPIVFFGIYLLALNDGVFDVSSVVMLVTGFSVMAVIPLVEMDWKHTRRLIC